MMTFPISFCTREHNNGHYDYLLFSVFKMIAKSAFLTEILNLLSFIKNHMRPYNLGKCHP